MFKCLELAVAKNPNTKPISGQHCGGGSSNKRQQRKLVLYENSLAANILLLLVLFLFLSIHCIGLAKCGQVSPSSVTGLGKAISSSSSSGKDGASVRGSGGIGSAVDDGELSSHHHQHNYHRQHRHSSSGKNLPQTSSSTSSSYGFQQEYSPLSYYNSDAYYESRYHDRPSREFSARSTSYPAMVAAASTSQVGFAEPEYGGLALATGHGGGHGGHGGHGHGNGHGHDAGYGHGHHTTYYKTVNKVDQSSLGLLGLLGLLSLLSNVLLLLTTTAPTTMMMMMERQKRDTMMVVKLKREEDSARRSVVERLSRLILPSLNVVGHAKDGRVPLNCTYQEVCKTNKALVQVFGTDDGRPVASVLSTAIIKLLTNNGRIDKKARESHRKTDRLQNEDHRATPLLLVKKLLTDAGLAGRNGEDCELIYPTCNALSSSDDYSLNGIKKGDSFQLPFLISPEHALSIIMGQSGTSVG